MQRIAILGGGLGSMATALELTRPGVNLGKYDITVYHMGWRLGGKGASGRNASVHQRIEEHGLHVWLGFYENAFRVMREVLAEWNIPPNHPWSSPKKEDRWLNAFHPHTYAPLTDLRPDGHWETWDIRFPIRDNGTPGDGEQLDADFWGIIMRLEHSLLGLLLDDSGPAFRSHEKHVSQAAPKMTARGRKTRKNHPQLSAAYEKVHQAKSGCLDFFGLGRLGLLKLAESMCDLSAQELLQNPLEPFRRLGIILNLGWAILRGLLRDYSRIQKDTLDVLDDLELCDWLRTHGAHQDAVDSPVVRALYDAIFAWEDGDPAHQRLAAGAGLRCLLRIFFSYKHALSWKMQAGMGDTIFTPMYDVLKARGVKFEFFHEVQNLGLSEDKKSIQRLTIGRQITVKDPTKGYQPLTEVNGLHCWPSEPLWDQIVEADAIRAGAHNLEHANNRWKPVETLHLEVGRDFDHIVLGIAIGAHPLVAQELIQASPRYAAMVKNVKTVRTMAHQCWLDVDLAGTGWDKDSPILSNFVDPLNTWCDMTDLIPREQNPPTVRSIHYFCGPMKESIPAAQADQAVHTETDAMRDAMAQNLWPALKDAQGRFDKAHVVHDYYRTNINPSDHYVLTLPGCTRHRLHPGDSGFSNLTLAGDWTQNRLNVGCVEATVMSGLFASQAISGRPLDKEIAYSKGP